MSDYKDGLHQHVIDAVKEELATAEKAAAVAKETATHKENIAENKYDTLGLEASYLAHGQSQRVEALWRSVNAYEEQTFVDFCSDDEIELTALVSLRSESGAERYFLIGADMGGLRLNYQQREIVVITPQSPLGKQLVGKCVGDEVVLLVKRVPVIFEIVNID